MWERTRGFEVETYGVVQGAHAARARSAEVAGHDALHGSQRVRDADDRALLCDRPCGDRADEYVDACERGGECCVVGGEVARADLNARDAQGRCCGLGERRGADQCSDTLCQRG